MNRYPVLNLVTRFGKRSVYTLVALIAVGLFVMYARGDANLVTVCLACVGLLLALVLALSFVELVALVVEMLVPHSE